MDRSLPLQDFKCKLHSSSNNLRDRLSALISSTLVSTLRHSTPLAITVTSLQSQSTRVPNRRSEPAQQYIACLHLLDAFRIRPVPAPCIAPTLCASRARRLPPRSRIRRRRCPAPSRDACSAGVTLVSHVPVLLLTTSSTPFRHRSTDRHGAHRACLPQAGRRCLRPGSRQEAVAAREDGKERHA
jgi:hypothetical protein